MYKITEVTHINKGYASKAMLVAKEVVDAANSGWYAVPIETIKARITDQIKSRYSRINSGHVLDYIELKVEGESLEIIKRQLMERKDDTPIVIAKIKSQSQ